MRFKRDKQTQVPAQPQTAAPDPADEIPRFCPDCGAANSSNGLRCTICGHQFASSTEVAQFWDAQTQESSRFDTFGDLYEDPSTALTFEDEDDLSVTRPYAPVRDPWSSTGGRLGADTGAPDAFVPPSESSKKKKRTGGPPAWVLGLIGLILIAAVAVATLALVVRPMVADRIETTSGEAISQALARATIVPDISAGTVSVPEQQINRSLRANAASYKPIEGARVQIRRSGFVVAFSVYGYESTLTGDLEVIEGRIVIVDPKLDGYGDRLLEVRNVANQVETALNDLLARNSLQATAVTLTDDLLTITTQSAPIVD